MAVKAVKEREFQSTLPRGERPNADIDASRKGIFQSTLPRGERHVSSECAKTFGIFQSTLPRGERHQRFPLFYRLFNFNPRSREGSDKWIIQRRQKYIYFNPRSREGSDITTQHGDVWLTISIHAPARGATLPGLVRRRAEEFQSTLPRGERPLLADVDTGEVNFNPRSREGSDIKDGIDATFDKLFQSTLPRGERLFQFS